MPKQPSSIECQYQLGLWAFKKNIIVFIDRFTIVVLDDSCLLGYLPDTVPPHSLLVLFPCGPTCIVELAYSSKSVSLTELNRSLDNLPHQFFWKPLSHELLDYLSRNVFLLMQELFDHSQVKTNWFTFFSSESLRFLLFNHLMMIE